MLVFFILSKTPIEWFVKYFDEKVKTDSCLLSLTLVMHLLEHTENSESAYDGPLLPPFSFLLFIYKNALNTPPNPSPSLKKVRNLL